MNQSTALAVHSGALARIGTADEREYLVGIMAETLGIPARDAGRADVIALLGMAAQQTMTYGALPGIHLHVQKFESKESKERRNRNPGTDPDYTYTLVQGEKLWKDSGARWRIMYGVNWTYQRKPMTPEEIAEQARLMGYTNALPPIAYGMWARIIMIGVDDPKDNDNPMWSSGIFFGKRKAGNYWFDEDLPTGVTSRDVAVRRADKRAMMQSSLSLLPLDSLLPSERLARLTDHLRSEGEAHRGDPYLHRQKAEIEEDGDMLWQVDPQPPRRLAVPDMDAGEIFDEAVADGSWAETPAEADARPSTSKKTSEKAGAWPDTPQDTEGSGPCQECHAPAGKPHATSCSHRSERQHTPQDAPQKVDARPRPSEKAVARPAKSAAKSGGEWDTYASVLHNADVRIDSDLAQQIRAFHDKHANSTAVLSEAQYKLLRMLFLSVLQAQDPEHKMVLSCLCGTSVNHLERPGNQLRDLIDWLKSPNKYLDEVSFLTEILELCRLVRQEIVQA